MTGALWRSAFVAAVFAVHPLRAESVAWVAERKDVLGAFFFMLTLGAYVRYVEKQKAESRKQKFSYLLALVFFGLGLLCKPAALALPFALLLLDYWPLQRFAPQPHTRGFGIPRRLILEKLPLLALAAAAGVVTYFAEAQGKSVVPIASIPIPMRVGNVFISYAVYLRQMLWPAGLAVYYPYPDKSDLFWETALALVLLGIISGVVLAQWRKRPWLLAGWFWYLAMMAPVIGIVAVNPSTRGDRYTYLPQIGLSVLLAWAVADWSAAWKHRRVLLGGLMAVVIGALMVCGRIQVSYWKDSESLWRRALACTSANSVAHNNLGQALCQKGELAEAVRQCNQALAINPDFAEAHFNLGIALHKQGMLEEAVTEYNKALRIQPDYMEAHYNLGLALVKEGKLDEAIAQYRSALEINPANEDARYNLGNALVKAGNPDEAIAQYRQALQINPDDAEARNNLGVVYAGKGQWEEAIAQYQRALQINPHYADACFNLGRAFLRKGDFDAALACFQKTTALSADPLARWSGLANDFLQKKDFDEAIVCSRQALKINPRSAGTWASLGLAYFQKGQAKEAIESWQQALELEPDQLYVLNNLAWCLATTPDPFLRDGGKAVALAKQADQLSGGANPVVLHTLAAAEAETGGYPLAAATARRALELAAAQKNNVLAATLQKEIALYEAGQAVRDSTTKESGTAPARETPQRGEPTAREAPP
jgi:tetratricopeptide (TPR) repeat protein